MIFFTAATVYQIGASEIKLSGIVSRLMIARMHCISIVNIPHFSNVISNRAEAPSVPGKSAIRERAINYYEVREEVDQFSHYSSLDLLHIEQKLDIDAVITKCFEIH